MLWLTLTLKTYFDLDPFSAELGGGWGGRGQLGRAKAFLSCIGQGSEIPSQGQGA